MNYVSYLKILLNNLTQSRINILLGKEKSLIVIVNFNK